MIRKNKQLVVDKGRGDCMRACLTSILGIPNSKKIMATPDDPQWHKKFQDFLYQFGLSWVYDSKKYWRPDGYWIARVPSKNFPDAYHAIVMKGTMIFHDPTTKVGYKACQDLLGTGVVLGGWYLEVIDSSKLHKLNAYIKSRK